MFTCFEGIFIREAKANKVNHSIYFAKVKSVSEFQFCMTKKIKKYNIHIILTSDEQLFEYCLLVFFMKAIIYQYIWFKGNILCPFNHVTVIAGNVYCIF